MSICVATRCKDESNIIEWMLYYYKIGFDHIYIYDDDSNPTVFSIVNNSFDKDKYTITTNEYKETNINIRAITMNNKLYNLTKKYDYCLFIDLDEYLVLNHFKNIQEVLKYYEPFDMLKINWVLFGNNGHKYKPKSNSLIENFTHSENCINNTWVKSIGKTCKIIENLENNNPHTFKLIDDNVIIKNLKNEISKEKTSTNENSLQYYDYKKLPIYLAHYIIQSTETFIIRRFLKKGRTMSEQNIKLISDNMDAFIEIFHNDLRNHELVKNNKEINSYMNFFIGHNQNKVLNLDLLDKIKDN